MCRNLISKVRGDETGKTAVTGAQAEARAALLIVFKDIQGEARQKRARAAILPGYFIRPLAKV